MEKSSAYSGDTFMAGEAVRKDIVDMNITLSKTKNPSNTRSSSGTNTPTRGRRAKSPSSVKFSVKPPSSVSCRNLGSLTGTTGATRGRKKKAFIQDKVDYNSDMNSDSMSCSSKHSSDRCSVSTNSKRI